MCMWNLSLVNTSKYNNCTYINSYTTAISHYSYSSCVRLRLVWRYTNTITAFISNTFMTLTTTCKYQQVHTPHSYDQWPWSRYVSVSALPFHSTLAYLYLRHRKSRDEWPKTCHLSNMDLRPLVAKALFKACRRLCEDERISSRRNMNCKLCTCSLADNIKMPHCTQTHFLQHTALISQPTSDIVGGRYRLCLPLHQPCERSMHCFTGVYARLSVWLYTSVRA